MRRRSRAARVLVALASITAFAACRRSHLPPKPDGASVIVVEPDAATAAAGAAPKIAYAPEVEPNDTISHAMPVALPAAGASVGIASSPVAGKDVDVFRLTISPGPPTAAPVARRRLVIDVFPEAKLAVTTEALDGKDVPLGASMGSAPGEHDGMPNIVVEGGPIVVRIKATGEGSYKVVFGLAPLDVGDEVEPNGKPIQATDASLPDEKTGFLGWRRDEDWWRVPLGRVAEGGVLWAELDGPVGVPAALAIHDAVGNKLGEQRSRGRSGRLSLRDVAVRPDDQNAFVVVRAASGRSLDARYVLRIGSDVGKPKVVDAGEGP